MSLVWRQHPILKPPTAEEMAQMEPAQLIELHTLYHTAISNSERDPYRYGFVLDNWRKAEGLLQKHDTLIALGGNRCLAGEQEIYDPVAQCYRRVDSITAPFHVYAWDEATKQLAVASAEAPFCKPVQPLYRVRLSNGQTLSCSAEHRVLTPSGWQAIGRLSVGSCISAPSRDSLAKSLLPACLPAREASTWGSVREAFPPDAASWTRTIPDSQCDCPPSAHCDDEPLRQQAGGGQDAAPSPAGARKHTSLFGSIFLRILRGASHLCECIRDGLDNRRNDNPFRTQLLHANTGALLPLADLSAGIESHAFYTPCKSAWLRCADQGASPDRPQFAAGFPLEQCGRQFPEPDIQSHYALAYSDNSTGVATILAVDFLRNDTVWDFTVPHYHNYIAGGVINHNSGKTQYGAWEVVRCALENESSLILCFAQNAELSVLVQQEAIFRHLPVEYKQKTLGQSEYISYTKQNGFAGNSVILPNASRILFKTYSQFQQNQTILEGLELGSFSPKLVNLGAWCDEYLGGPELIDTLGFRLATRNAKMLLTFTPIDGYSETIRVFLDGAKTLETRQAELLNNRPLPYVQQCKDRDAAILYLHTIDNPFSGYERVAKEAQSKGDEAWILCRLYGVPTKSISSKFPSFSREVNVVKHDTIPTEGVTRYMILDPAGRKKWFMAWVAIDASDTWWVYREWPDVSHGDWAEWRNGKWAAGEGAKRDGNVEGIAQYVDLIMQLEREGMEEIAERLIDPRLGAAKYQGATGVSSIIEDLADAGLPFVPAPGLEIDDGLQALHNKMAYDRSKPIDGNNRPRFYISERCENIIRALQEYTGDGGKDEAWKDPLDVIRYAAIAGIQYIDPKWNQGAGRRSGGY